MWGHRQQKADETDRIGQEQVLASDHGRVQLLEAFQPPKSSEPSQRCRARELLKISHRKAETSVALVRDGDVSRLSQASNERLIWLSLLGFSLTSLVNRHRL